MRFRKYWLGGSDRLSIPYDVNSANRQQMLALYQPQRITSLALWNIIKRLPSGITVPGRIEISPFPSSRLTHFDWQNWVQQVAGKLELQKLSPAFYFPLDHGRKQCAALLLNDEGEGAFAKLSWGRDAAARLQQEKRGLDFAQQLTTVSAPQALALDCIDSTHYLLCELMPPGGAAPPTTWQPEYAKVWEEMQQRFGAEARLQNIDWWQKHKASAPTDAVAYLEKNEPPGGYRLGPCHGDLATWNAARHDGRLLLFDWEHFEEQAPRLADVFYFAIARAIYIAKLRDADAIRHCIDKALESIPHEHDERLLCQVYFLMVLPQNEVRDAIQTLIDQSKWTSEG